jgi:Holliday junction resolvase-like predicted endonuclease
MNDKVRKSSRHSKIVGDFGESLVLYWLSKHGFECAKVDHTGIDLIANNRFTHEVMGISVKSRTRLEGTETDTVNIPADDFKKIDDACRAFMCKPYIAVVVDAKDTIRVFIVSKEHLLALYPEFPQKANCYWKMSPTDLEKYDKDEDVKAFELKTKDGHWWVGGPGL